MAEVHKAGPARVGLELSNWLLKFWSFWDKDQTNQLVLASSSVAFNAVGLARMYRDPLPHLIMWMGSPAGGRQAGPPRKASLG